MQITASSPTPNELLIEALSSFNRGGSAAARELGDALLENLRGPRDGDDSSLPSRLLLAAGDDTARRAALVDFIGHAARCLAPNDEAPLAGAGHVAWSGLVSVANSLNGSGAYALGRPRFIGDVLFRRLVDEGHRQLASGDGLGTSRATGRAGDTLASLAVSRQLRETVSSALGFAAAPTYEALYEYDPPGSHVHTHVDSHDYEIVFHLLLEHTESAGGEGESVLIAHLPDDTAPARIVLRVGEALVLRGRGTLHSWQALGAGERRILTAIGFRRA